MNGSAGRIEKRAESVEAGCEVAALFARHHEAVFRAAHRITGSAQDAEDVLQTVFVRLIERDAPLPGEPSGGYFQRAAVNTSLDVLRRRKTARLEPLDEVDRLGSPEPGPHRLREASELNDRLRSALAGLPPRAAEIFVLRSMEGLDNRTIAKRLGTTWSVVAVTLHRARARLRREILGDRS